MKFLILYFWFLRLFCPGSHSHTIHCWKPFSFVSWQHLLVCFRNIVFLSQIVGGKRRILLFLSIVTALLSDGCSLRFLLEQHTVQKSAIVTKDPQCCFQALELAVSGLISVCICRLQSITEGREG